MPQPDRDPVVSADEMIRLESIKLAVARSPSYLTTHELLTDARQVYEFIKGGETTDAE